MKYYVKLAVHVQGFGRTVEAESPEEAEAMVREEFHRIYGKDNLSCVELSEASPGRAVFKRRNLRAERDERVQTAIKQIATGDFEGARETVDPKHARA